MAKLIGSAPNQISTNGDLGSMAFEDKKNYATTSSPIYQPYRNIIINGDMSIAQRGTSATVSDGSNEGYNTLDRFYTNFNAGIGGAIDLTQDTTVPDNQGFAKSLKIQCQTTSTSFTGNMNLQIYQEIEAQNLQHLSYGSSSPKNIVYSFWCKATNYTSPLSAIFRTRDGTAEHFVKSFTPTSTWQKFTFSVPGSTTATIDNDNGSGLRVGICLAGSTDNEAPDSTSWSTTRKDQTDTQGNFLSSTNNILYITGVQLEAGTTASDFEFLPTAITKNLCNRYYQLIAAGPNHHLGATAQNIVNLSSYSTATAYGVFHLSQEMRAAPSIDQVVGTDYYKYYNNSSSADNFDQFQLFSNATTKIVGLNNQDAMAIGAGQSGWVVGNNNNTYFALDAEL